MAQGALASHRSRYYYRLWPAHPGHTAFEVPRCSRPSPGSSSSRRGSPPSPRALLSRRRSLRPGAPRSTRSTWPRAWARRWWPRRRRSPTRPTSTSTTRGRVWVIEAVNYRVRAEARGPRGRPHRHPRGHRPATASADKSTVFYQGPDVDAAWASASSATSVIVSPSPNVFVFTDADGDDKPDKKEVLFTGSPACDHDHGCTPSSSAPTAGSTSTSATTASAADGPGGQRARRHAAGNRGRADDGKPYQPGDGASAATPTAPASRCSATTSATTTSSPSTPSAPSGRRDNDDDGNRGVRINYVMEGGNFGYRDEMTGAGWRDAPHGHGGATSRAGTGTRTTRASVPNVLHHRRRLADRHRVYEGTLLPAPFRGRSSTPTPGRTRCRAYPVRADGAGYTATSSRSCCGPRDRMFRPIDVAVAPDGSLFVADWYDPGVGGHDMGDQDAGPDHPRRAAGHRATPCRRLDLSTPAGAARALRSPNHATRYLGYERLRADGRAAPRAALLAMYRGDEPVGPRAARSGCSPRIPERGARHLEAAARDTNPDIRIVALRATRRVGGDVIPRRRAAGARPVARGAARGRARACAMTRARAPRRSGRVLAQQHDGRDRWYLEALGIAADRQWDRYFAAWLDAGGRRAAPRRPDATSSGGRARHARSRCSSAWRATPRSAGAERLRYFRALDFHAADGRQRSLLAILETPAGRSADLTPDDSHPARRQDGARSPRGAGGARSARSPRRGGRRSSSSWRSKYDARDQLDELSSSRWQRPNETAGAEAARLALAWGGAPRFSALVLGPDESAGSPRAHGPRPQLQPAGGLDRRRRGARRRAVRPRSGARRCRRWATDRRARSGCCGSCSMGRAARRSHAGGGGRALLRQRRRPGLGGEAPDAARRPRRSTARRCRRC